MPYYTSPLVKVARGREPVGADTQLNRNWILFGDTALIWLADPVIDVRMKKIAEDSSEVLSSSSGQIITDLREDGKEYPAITFLNAVVDLLRSPPAGWGALRPSKVRGRYEIWLGPEGLLYQEKTQAAPNSKTFVDNFNRANADLNGSTSSDGLFTWLEVDGTAWTVANNRAEANGNTLFVTARANADLDTDDHYAQAAIVNYTRVAGTFQVPGLLCRWTGATNGYSLEVGELDTGAQRRIYRYDNEATLTSDTTLTTTGTIRLEVDGSSLTAKVDGATILSVTDVAHTGQLRCGISSFSTDAGNAVALDNYECGDLVVSAFRLFSLLGIGR